MDALSYLRRDHRELRALLKQLVATSDRAIQTRRRLVADLEARIDLHRAEEDVLFTALEPRAEAWAALAAARSAHQEIVTQLGQLASRPSGDLAWIAQAQDLASRIGAHLEDEERELFSTAAALLDRPVRERLGEEMRLRRLGEADRAVSTR